MLCRSHIYWGEVLHHRKGGLQHKFTHRLPLFLLDLDALTQSDHHTIPGNKSGIHRYLFNVNGPGLLGYHDADHGARDGTPFRDWLRDLLARHGRQNLRFRVLCMPRFFGYVFNPISVVYCFDDADRLDAVVYEVHNTFGESHPYVHLFEGVPAPHRSRKQLHVSPFFGMEGEYRFNITEPDEAISLGITYLDASGASLFAGFNGHRRPLTTAEILKTLMRAPLAAIGITIDIHWQAAKLWLKGARLHHKPDQEIQHG